MFWKKWKKSKQPNVSAKPLADLDIQEFAEWQYASIYPIALNDSARNSPHVIKELKLYYTPSGTIVLNFICTLVSGELIKFVLYPISKNGCNYHMAHGLSVPLPHYIVAQKLFNALDLNLHAALCGLKAEYPRALIVPTNDNKLLISWKNVNGVIHVSDIKKG